MKAEAE